jgi:NDP-sugar pyrophosphorylase family protein
VKTGEEKIMRRNTVAIPKAFGGIHIISSEIFSLMKQQQKKFSMVDVYLSLCAQHDIFSFDHSGSKLIDVGRPESLAIANDAFTE